MPNGESGYVSKANYADIGAGINYAIFPNEFVYIKIGASVAHLNQPNETFFTGQSNTLGMRPTGYIDMLARMGVRVVINPSIYYTRQKSASELMFGSSMSILLGTETTDGSLVFGGYYRMNEAVVGTFGYDWNGLRIMASYDFTTSQLGQFNNHNGALELGLRWQGSYVDKSARDRKVYNCPRF